MKLKQSCGSFTNPYSNLLVPPSVTREYHPKTLIPLDLLQCILAYLYPKPLVFLERHNTSVFFMLIFFPLAANRWVTS